MKTLTSTLALLAAIAFAVQGQIVAAPGDDEAPNAPSPSQSTTLQIGERGPHHRVWQKVSRGLDESGRPVLTTNQAFIELGGGMHVMRNNNWIEAQEGISVLPQGGAAATNGQHQVYFPPDIYGGLIELLVPEGQHLKMRPMGISYLEGTNSVLIAELTNSIGVILASGNQVIYMNAFSDFAADLLCTYRKGGFECDLVLRERPPGPEEYGLSSNARLQLLTEFFDTPAPAQRPALASRVDGLRDSMLVFGCMRMVRGNAFVVGNGSGDGSGQDQPASNPNAMRIYKSWEQIQGRTFLIEELPYGRIRPQLDALPAPAGISAATRSPASVLHRVCGSRLLPPLRLAVQEKKTMQQAKLDWKARGGVVWDYQILTGSTNAFTFRGDTTYCVSNDFTISGTITIEGGTVVKFSRNGGLTFDGAVNCLTDSYRPAIFTAVDDNSVGESWSTNSPSGSYGGDAYIHTYDNPETKVLKNIRMSYAGEAFDLESNLELWNAQFVNCGQIAAVASDAVVTINNALFCGSGDYSFSSFFSGDTLQIRGSHWTVHGAGSILNGVCCSSFALTNSLLVGATLGGGGDMTIMTNVVPVLANDSGVFASTAAGYHYLAVDSPYRDVGTTNIDPTMLAALKKTTTYPPIVLSNQTNSVDQTLSPQAQRDTDAPDLGYHYDPLDYITDYYWITNCTLTVGEGTAIACCNNAGIVLQQNSTIVSGGSPLYPSWFVRYQSVQEQPLLLDGSSPSSAAAVTPCFLSGTPPNGQYRFTKFACPSAGGNHLAHSGYYYGNLLVQDCEFWNGTNLLSGGSYSSVATVKNCLFARSSLDAGQSSGTLAVSNSLFWQSPWVKIRQNASVVRYAFNNAFDNCAISTASILTNGWNAYINCTNRLNPAGTNDVVLSSFTYTNGPLGNFYQFSTNLVDRGCTNANLVGLYHYTTQASQVKETNSLVDIGYHYVACTNGVPIDTEGDATPDYLEDADGNGSVNSGETDWRETYDSPNGLVLPNGLQVFTPLK
jgi:hypothetical protein